MEKLKVNTIVEQILNLIQGLLIPFSQPDKHNLYDWHERITLVTHLSEILQLKASEFATAASSPCKTEFSLIEAQAFLDGFSDFELQTRARLDIIGYQNLIDYAKVDKSMSSDDRVGKMFTGVVSVEKLAISTCSLAISRYSLPIQAIIELVSVIRDECLHLLSLARLINVNPLDGGWITCKRQPAWNQILNCNTPLEHVMLEHCLFEGEGAISARYTIYLAVEMNFPETAISVVRRIADEETRHATIGYFLSGLLSKNDNHRVSSSQTALHLIREIEPLDYSNSVKLFKQNTAESVLLEYAQTGDWMAATKKIVCYAMKAEEGVIS